MPNVSLLSCFHPSTKDFKPMILDSVGVSIKEFNNLFRQCSACAHIMLAANTKHHLCKDSIFRDSLGGNVVGIKAQGSLNYLAESQPESASTLTELNSQEGVSAHTFKRTFLVCTHCSFCMTHKAAGHHRCSPTFQ